MVQFLLIHQDGLKTNLTGATLSILWPPIQDFLLIKNLISGEYFKD